MTLDQFKLLTSPEQDEEVMNHGLFLINHIHGDTMCDVYRLYDFYVKFCYNVNNDDDPEIIVYSTDEHVHLYNEGLSDSF